MLLKIFTIYDQKAKAHLPPFFFPREEMAVRTFTDCVNSADHQFGKHPEDYTLIEIGTFDEESAKIEPRKVPNVLGTGINFIQAQIPEPAQD